AGTAGVGAARGERAATGINHRYSEEPARRIWTDGFRGALEEEAGGGFGGRRDSHAGDSQTYGIAGAFGGGNRVSDPVSVVPSGNCGAAGRAWAPAREGKFPDH